MEMYTPQSKAKLKRDMEIKIMSDNSRVKDMFTTFP